MYRTLLPDGTFIEAQTRAELFRLIKEAAEAYKDYLK